MYRRSRSPENRHHTSTNDDRYRRQRPDDNNDRYSTRDSRDNRDHRSYNSRDERQGRYDRERDYRREYDRHGYGQQERELERQRDRERYDRGAQSSEQSATSRRRDGSVSRSASPPVNKAKPNFSASGLLAAETNTVKSIDGKNSTVLKYNEPPEARKPVVGWRLYVFKGEDQTDMLHIHRQSAYLFGRDRLVADVPVEHPSCSKQHAVIQYRYIKEKDEFGSVKGTIKPFIIDLESTNGTHVNSVAIPPSRYYELQASDVIKFGLSEREYVLLHDEAS